MEHRVPHRDGYASKEQVMKPGEMQERLDAISDDNGVPYGRVHELFDAERAYGLKATKFQGYLSLSDAFKSFFLETAELFNSRIVPRITAPLSEYHAMFFPRLFYAWQSLCGFERLALHGYPLQAYSGIRNIFDSVQALSAALQGFVDFYAIEGIIPGQAFDAAQMKKLRRKAEQEISLSMSGSKSGLSQATIDELALWDSLFNYEVHGGRLSLANAQGFMRGKERLPIFPQFRERDFAMFMNRYCEIAWMTHRLIPLVQPSAIPFDQRWKDKWTVIDKSFGIVSLSLTQENGKAIGAAIVEYVNAKFPFNANTTFPLN
jgi:hypothetical protein